MLCQFQRLFSRWIWVSPSSTLIVFLNWLLNRTFDKLGRFFQRCSALFIIQSSVLQPWRKLRALTLLEACGLISTLLLLCLSWCTKSKWFLQFLWYDVFLLSVLTSKFYIHFLFHGIDYWCISAILITCYLNTTLVFLLSYVLYPYWMVQFSCWCT